ncbi:hypothetical protein BDV96DRAFT_646421 [Lophiotrema nucula]|uniref:Uncharacterized protein n=1 Tax=Lophiotrema nucula TaxID=690887 RepID=A0A6A5Z921_9PLEO|nr:hypothetical protein BDV96DRAFT_646421 [Lophiotrema nucula]
MPRHKRQRPSWLPRWVPYKDGRYLGLARQTILAWSSTVLALSFFLMTVAYAAEKSKFSKVKFVHASRSNTILVLRILSEIAGVFLAGSIYSTFEVVQWVLISRPEGIRLPQFLALQSSTGPLGLLVLALGKGLPASQWPMMPRYMSLLRLMGEFAVPVLGVLIMSNVNTNVLYTPIKSTVTPFSVGMEPFNGSVAAQLGTMEDLLFNMAYVTFLINPLHAVDLSPGLNNKNGCAKGLSVNDETSCFRHISIAQEYQNVDASLPTSFVQNLDSDALVSLNQQVYGLEYWDNVNVTGNLQCETFSSGPGYYQFCASNGDEDELLAALIPCPIELVNQGACLQDQRWMGKPKFTSSLKASFFNATIAYDRQDGRILSHDITTDAVPVTISASEVVEAMTHILNTTQPFRTSQQPSTQLLGYPSNMFGRLVTGHMYRIGKMMANNNPAARQKGVNSLQALLGITLFYCQNGVLSQTVLPFAPKGNGTATPASQSGAFGRQDQNTFIALAQTRYRIKIGRGTLIAYIVLGGVALAICIIALSIGSIIELMKLEAEPTLWPALDFWTQCRVETADGALVPADKRSDLAWIRDGRQLFKEIEPLRVKRRQRKLREATELSLPGANGEGRHESSN